MRLDGLKLATISATPVTIASGLATAGRSKALLVLGILEAAIGIEPMNKGFAEFAFDFNCVWSSSFVYARVSLFHFPSHVLLGGVWPSSVELAHIWFTKLSNSEKIFLEVIIVMD